MCTPTGASSLVSPRSVSSHKGRYPTDALPGFLTQVPFLSFHPLLGKPFWPSSRPLARPICPLLTSPLRSTLISQRSVPPQAGSHATSQGTEETSRGKTQNLPRVNAGFIKYAPLADGGLRGHVPTRPGCITPQIRFLFIAPQFRIGLPSDPASRRRPCPSPCLRLCENLAIGLAPTK